MERQTQQPQQPQSTQNAPGTRQGEGSAGTQARPQQGREPSRAMQRQGQPSGLTRGWGGGMPSSLTASPFSMMRRMMDDMDRMFENFGLGGMSPLEGWAPSRAMDLIRPMELMTNAFPSGSRLGMPMPWSPQIEVAERDNQLIVKADLPGLTNDDIRLQVLDDALLIEGERRQEREEQRGGVSYSERTYGSFARTIPIPEGVQADDVDATFDNGVLEVRVKLPVERSKGRSVPIRASGREGSAGQVSAGQGSAGQVSAGQGSTGQASAGQGSMASTESAGGRRPS